MLVDWPTSNCRSSYHNSNMYSPTRPTSAQQLQPQQHNTLESHSTPSSPLQPGTPITPVRRGAEGLLAWRGVFCDLSSQRPASSSSQLPDVEDEQEQPLRNTSSDDTKDQSRRKTPFFKWLTHNSASNSTTAKVPTGRRKHSLECASMELSYPWVDAKIIVGGAGTNPHTQRKSTTAAVL